MIFTLKTLKDPTKINSNLPVDSHLETLTEEYKFLHPKVHNLAKEILKIKRQRFIKYKLSKSILVVIEGVALMFLLYCVYQILNFPQVSFTTKKEVVTVYKSDTTMNLRNYLLQIAYMESRNKPDSRRVDSQFWGLYQIGERERKNAGYGDISWDVYKNHSEIQTLCMLNLLKYNEKQLNEEIKKYSGKVVDGILISKSGILGLAHLGVGYAKECLKSGVIPEEDEHGNSPRQYAKLGGYLLN